LSKLKLVGMGPGSADYITQIAKESVQNAQIVIGAKRALELFSDFINCESVVLTAENMKEGLQHGLDSAKKGKNVVILSTGDPGFSGLLGTITKIAGKNIDVEVIPGVSSVQVCAARLCIRWDTAVLLSFHTNVSQEKKKAMVEALKIGKTVIALPDYYEFTPEKIAEFLISSGIDKSMPATVCENLTLQNERIVKSSLAGILGKQFDKLCIMTVGAD
jgi:cobalt-precorrin-7 (C5)-methyltransferase